MRSVRTALAVLGIGVFGLFAFAQVQTTSIKGTVTPADGAISAAAISGTDTLRSVITNGSFEIANLTPGTYSVLIEASAPYQNKVKDTVVVNEGESTDVGEIALEPQQ